MEFDDGFAPSTNSKPLAGNHVLVVSSRREMRALIRDALKNMGLVIDFVNSVDEASDFCRDGLPHAIVIEAIQNGERFSKFRDEIVAEVPDFAFIEIIEEGNTFEMSGFSGSRMARVGRDVIANSLPSALMFELSKSL
jgi:CheY-like chemotaxis protein